MRMRRIAIVVVCLCCLVSAQGTYTGGATWGGGGIWGAGFQSGSQYSDLPLPDFTSQGGVPLSLPQLWVDPLEAFAQAIDNTVYIGNTSNGCPNAPARTNYLGQVKSAGQCDYYDSNGSGIQSVTNDWCALSGGGYDQRWDVVITHGTLYNWGNGSWTWCTKYNGTVASKYLVFHTDCSASSPCTGTNDLGYNPDGRQVCSHGINDMLIPAVPSMGQRNHGCAGYLGLPGVDAEVPIRLSDYTHDTNYNDVANMFTITSTTGGTPPINMGAASTQGGANRCDGNGGVGTSACPVQGVNHIILADAHITTSVTSTQQFSIANFVPAEWQQGYPADQPLDYSGAIANHIGMTRFYLDGTADDDGYGVAHTVNGIRFGCSYCFLTHGYADGIKCDGTESHVISLNDGYGPTLISDMWIEGGSIGLWGGGGGNPSIRGGTTNDVEVRRTRVTYNPRWYPQPGGNQAFKKTVTGGSCTGGTILSLNISNATSGAWSNITNANAVYLSAIKDSGGTKICSSGASGCEGWYTASALDGAHLQVTVPSCSGTPAQGSVWGFADNYLGAINITAAGMAGKDPTGTSSPDQKDRIESKTWQRVLIDGIIDENSVAEGQQGTLLGNNARAYSNCAYDSGNETAVIQDFTLTNSIFRGGTQGIALAARSGSGRWSADASGNPYTITSVVCTGTTQATVTAVNASGSPMNGLMYNAPNYHPDLTKNCSQTLDAGCSNPETPIGVDVYLSGVGGGLIPDGWYTTAYPHNGDYSNAGTSVTVLADPNGLGNVCTTANGTASSGGIYAVSQGAGHGVSWAEHRMVYQNVLLYNLGDHKKTDGTGTADSFQATSAGNNFSVQVIVNPDNTTATATILANENCPGAGQCPQVIQGLAGDLAYIRCLGDDRFSSGPVGSKGVTILSVASNQLSFTYTPQNGSPLLASGNTTSCPLETPIQTANGIQSGYYNNQSFPWPFYINHLTAVGTSGMDFNFGPDPTFHKYATLQNSFELAPGASDTGVVLCMKSDGTDGGTCNYGFHANGEPYSPGDTSGITAGNDRNSLTFKSWALSTRSISNYPMFPCGTPPSNGCLTGGNPIIYPGTPSAPPNVATLGTSVTCLGVPCDATHYIPDSIGFVGAINTTTYPLALSDWRNYALHSSSPYKGGGMLQATDGLDNGVQIPLITNALSRTTYVCGLYCGSGPHRDGPQYGFLQWSPYPGAQNYRVYRDGGTSPVATVTTIWFDDYGLPAGAHTWTVKAWDGAAEHVVAGLSAQIY